MQQNHYGRLGAVLSADLINLPEVGAASVHTLLEAHEIRRPEVEDLHVEGFRHWRDQLARVFRPDTPAEQCSAVNDLLVEATIRPWVTTHDGLQPHLHFVPDEADVLSRVKAVTAGGLAFVLCWEGGARLGRCRRPECSRAYVDTSRNGRRRYCSARCGNTEAVMRHRSRNAQPKS
ncbi:CGNR zinc finger domain-containing protein [Streptomyces sp. NPDC060006]|uniref:CGNR zinc finger domain-containing protein n=1 Tax=unclassified Streptomyces TaxID=2593676 RepID=UPI0022ABC86C|nr:CGNR zinc finger domain-containing protein [Streptomyces aurantiacus]WAU83184.1 CGNR zinc finger domain-containing protein [Streptomyces aurantiacus]